MNSTALMDDNLCARTIGQRWADALRKRYATQKDIERAFNAAPGTVKGWLAGQAPQQTAVARAINLHGPSLAGEIYAPGAGWTRAAALKAKLDAILAACQEAREELIALEAME